MHKLVVLGGSSPFTVGLVDALVDALGAAPGDATPVVQPLRLVLVGRDADHLEIVATYAQRRLADAGWRCSASLDAASALDGAWGVLHQIRYGDLALRAATERLCRAHGVAADETLGPAALLTAVLSRREIDRTTALIERHCAQAWVVNLTNPLSLVTGTMARTLPRCIGVCELPLATARLAAAALELDPARLDWDYRGLNHRGFIVRLAQDGRDLLPLLAERLRSNARTGAGTATLGGLSGDCIAELDALPLKYFSLMLRPAGGEPGRADYLVGLRRQIAAQLRADPTRSPPAARLRDQAWYPLAVLPMLAALQCPRPMPRVVNQLCGDGLVWEQAAPVSAAGVGTPLAAAPASAPAEHWLARFAAHEAAAVRALANPTSTHLRQALEADPALSGAGTDALLCTLQEAITHHEDQNHAYA
jgi:6-phospho-beta-glucosidase